MPRDVDAATLAEAAARAAQNAATFRATGLRGYVEVADVQVDEDEGIRFLLEFINEGSDPIELSDVTNALNITLFRRTIPGGGHVIPPWSPYRTGPPVYTTEYPDEAEIRAEARAAKKELEKRRPYGVAEPMRRSPKIRTIRDIRDTEEVHLNPGERFQMVVRITQGLVDPAEYWWNQAELSKRLNGFSLQSPDPSDIGALIAGEYSLSLWVSVSVSTPDAEETATRRQHALLFCDSIPIRLGEEPENSAEK